jgi:heptosyltransferase-1
MRVLLVKMSSLGDVVHTLAPVTDAVRANPALEFDWVVEETYEAIPPWHPAVRRVIPVALRRWRRSPWSMLRDNEWFRFRADLRKTEYDLVLDAQGLMKSGWIGTQARGPLVGRSRNSAREPLAAAFYRRRYEVDLNRPEVEQIRQLFALALGYPQPTTPADFGIDRSRISPAPSRVQTAVLVHGAAWRNKLWPVENWRALGKYLAGRGLKILLPWGNDEEKCRAEQIADHSGGEVLPKLGISGLAALLAPARVVVGLDTGLTHIAIALGSPTITLYGPSVPVYDRVASGKAIHLSSTGSRDVDLNRPNIVPLAAVLEAAERLMD